MTYPSTVSAGTPLRFYGGTFLLLLLAAIGGLISINAAESGAKPTESLGSVTGRVQNGERRQYLNNARVTVRGTALTTFTDDTGAYFLPRVRAGEVIVEVFYTGLQSQNAVVLVNEGEDTRLDFVLTGETALSPGEVRLESLTVTAQRDTDASSIAINEQRFSPNIKLVVSADSLGDVTDGNVGELLKFLPGVSAEYDQADDTSTVSSISIRGFASNMVAVSTDGAQMANISGASGGNRTFYFNQASINNVSRIEVFKVPTPADAANSMAGSVNMVSKSAFERDRAQLRYTLDVSATSLDFGLGQSRNRNGERVFKTLPGLTFDYTLPVSDRFGIVVTGASTHRYSKLQERRLNYNTGGTATGASRARPFLQSFDVVDNPRIIDRNSLGVKADFRVSRHSILTLGAQGSHYQISKFPTRLLLDAGANANPTVAGGGGFSYGETETRGATGRGNVAHSNADATDRIIDSGAGNVGYRFDNGDWRITSNGSYSLSKGGNRDVSEGHFAQLGMALRSPVRVALLDVGSHGPGRIQVTDNSNTPINVYDISNYRLNTAGSTPRQAEDTFTAGNVNVRKQIHGFRLPASLQVGGAWQLQTRDIRRESSTWTYNGMNGDFSPAPFMSVLDPGRTDVVNLEALPHISSTKAWAAFQANPALFTQTPAQAVTARSNAIRASQYIEEAVTAFHLQGEIKFFNGRLNTLGGVRFEEVAADGVGPLFEPGAAFLRDPDGTFARDSQGRRLRKPEAGSAGSIEELRLTLKERAAEGHRKYSGFYPSLHLNYELKEGFLVRLAYARTYGRPDFTEIIPNVEIDEEDNENVAQDPSIVPGQVTVKNPSLRPWHANNYDLSLEYYTRRGGLLSVGFFHKEISDFFATGTRIMTLADTAELGLDPGYVGWRASTNYNGGDARVTGAEFNLRQSLSPFGEWGRNFHVFANGTKLRLNGNQDASFAGFVPELLNGGLSFGGKVFSAMVRANYRGKQKGTRYPSFGADAFQYDGAIRTVDVSAEMRVSRTLSVFCHVQNLFDAENIRLREGSETPEYATVARIMNTGATVRVGVKGSF